jgi:hypothetical protein
MKKLAFLWLISWVIIISWCSIGHNFMDVDNPNAKDDLKYYIWSGNFPKINTDNIIPDSLSWARNDAKWYASKYYEENLGEYLDEYVDMAKEWLSWAKESLKWYYNDGVDELNKMVNDKVSGVISWEFNKFKIK